MSNPRPKSALLTVDDIADRLGVSEKTVRRYMRLGKLEYIRLPGGQLRVEPAAFDAWLDERHRRGAAS